MTILLWDWNLVTAFALPLQLVVHLVVQIATLPR
jgi:hypothetical protein